MGKFAEKVAEVMAETPPPATDWRERLAGQEARLGQHIPSSRDEAFARAKTLLSQLKDMAYQTGFGLRAQRHSRGDVEQLLEREDGMPQIPSREHMINFPIKEAETQEPIDPEVKLPPPETKPDPMPTAQGKHHSVKKLQAEGKVASWFEPRLLSKEALLGAVTEPLYNKYEDMMVNLRNTLAEKRLRGMHITADPLTIPSFAPSVALEVPQSFVHGYRAADQAQAGKLRSDMDQRLERATHEFNTALKDEYAATHQKAASAGELIDGLAQWWTKEAEGELNKVLGLYLAAAGLLGVGGHAAAKSMWEKHDPRYQRLKAMKDLIRTRQRHLQLPVLVTEEHLPSEDTAPLAGPPGQLGLESTTSGVPNTTTKAGSLSSTLGYAANSVMGDAAHQAVGHIHSKLKHRKKK